MTNANTVIQFNRVSKFFYSYENKTTSLKEKIINVLKSDREVVKKRLVLDNVSFSIYRGETVGIIGRNGSGKSTILKLISEILYPEKGEIEIYGTVAALLEIGAGFQADLTGRENVYLYGAILGIPKKEIDGNFDEIVKFSEIGQYIDTPVKNYSSGMYMRLAFSVAISVNPEILLIDEVLAVGDELFQKKCLKKINELKNRKKTILFVSHDLNAVRDLCDRVFYLKNDGSLIFGETDLIIDIYLNEVYFNNTSGTDIQNQMEVILDTALQPDSSASHEEEENVNQIRRRWGNKDIEILEINVFDNKGPRSVFKTGDDLLLKGIYRCNKSISSAVFGIALYNSSGVHISGPNSKQDGQIVRNKNVGEYDFEITIYNLPLLRGNYYITVAVYDFECEIPLDYLNKWINFDVMQSNRQSFGIIPTQCGWKL